MGKKGRTIQIILDGSDSEDTDTDHEEEKKKVPLSEYHDRNVDRKPIGKERGSFGKVLISV